MTPQERRDWFGGICLVVSCIVWSGNYVLGKLLMEQPEVSPTAVSFWRFLLAGGVMLAIGLPLRGWRRFLLLPRRDWLEITGQGVLGMCAVGLLMFWSERLTSAINASMLDALIPVTILLGGVLLGQKLTGGQILGIAMSLLGCILINRILGPHGLQLTRLSLADLLVVAAAIAWAAYVLWGKSTLRRVDSLVYTTWAMWAGLTGTALYSLLSHSPLALPPDGRVWELMGLLAAGPTLIAFWAWNKATAIVPLPLLNITQYLIPVAAVFFAHWILKEPLDLWQWSGTGLIFAGVALDPSILNRFRKRCRQGRINSGRSSTS